MTAVVPKTMKAVICHGPGDYRLHTDVPVPEPRAGELLVRVARVGICAGDAKCFAGTMVLFFGLLCVFCALRFVCSTLSVCTRRSALLGR